MESQTRTADSGPSAASGGASPRNREAGGEELVQLLVSALRALPPQGLRQVLTAMDADALRDALDAKTAQAEEAAGAQEHRAAARTRTLRGGKIVFNNRMSLVDCHIVDISETGCRVSVANAAIVPQYFTLHVLAGNTEHECEVVWRKPDELGLHFLE